jgi:hypothetical protein
MNESDSNAARLEEFLALKDIFGYASGAKSQGRRKLLRSELAAPRLGHFSLEIGTKATCLARRQRANHGTALPLQRGFAPWYSTAPLRESPPDLDLHCARVSESAKKLLLKPTVATEEWIRLAREGIAKSIVRPRESR